MLIHTASRQTGLTKKAIEYYCEQGLVSPSVLENGYRDFSPQDLERMQKIAALRKLGIAVQDIRSVLDDPDGETLRALSVRLELELQNGRTRQDILQRLSAGAAYADIRDELDALDSRLTLAEKILLAFPSFFGRFICLHFAQFLCDPVTTDKQKDAYRRVLRFLDTVPQPDFSREVRDLLLETSQGFGVAQIRDMQANTQALLQNPRQYLADHHDMIDRYRSMQQSETYLTSPVRKLKQQMKAFTASSGYTAEFLPAMRELSPSYAAYAGQLAAANDIFLAAYPDMASEDE